MKSKWFKLKPKALSLRTKGYSFREIEKKLGISRSTLSGWFKNIKLSKKQTKRLKKRWLNGLKIARKRAVLWHNTQKELRLKEAESAALNTLSKLETNNQHILELALAMLYLGEGSKTNQTALGSSDSLILKFFISAIIKIYEFDTTKIKCELHLRADQNPEKVKAYWSKELCLPLSSFTSISIDKRTIGSPTYSTYNGVCVLQCGKIAILRKLVYLSKLFCERIALERAVSSAGRASA